MYRKKRKQIYVKLGLGASTGDKRLCLFCFYVYKIDFFTEIFALDLSSLVIVRANNFAIS